jgi:glycosyltransferase involved in cell wall biosynthesis
MHDTATLLAEWRESEPSVKRLQWIFHASGTGYARLRRQAGDRSDIEWGGALPAAEWEATMKRAQVALITVAAGAERVVMPSKTYSAMVAGQALLAICPRHSDLADLVRQHDCGWVVEPGDVPALRQVLLQLRNDPGGLANKQQNSFAAGHRFYDVRPVAAHWLELMRELHGTRHSLTGKQGTS